MLIQNEIKLKIIFIFNCKMDSNNLSKFVISEIEDQIRSFIKDQDNCEVSKLSFKLDDAKITFDIVMIFNSISSTNKNEEYIDILTELIKHVVYYDFKSFNMIYIDCGHGSRNNTVTASTDMHVKFSDKFFVPPGTFNNNYFQTLPFDIIKLIIMRLNRCETMFLLNSSFNDNDIDDIFEDIVIMKIPKIYQMLKDILESL